MLMQATLIKCGGCINKWKGTDTGGGGGGGVLGRKESPMGGERGEENMIKVHDMCENK